MEINFCRISWDALSKHVIALSEKLRGRHVYGIPRGGRLIAAYMAYHGCVFVGREPVNTSVVIVDDIADTGKTLSRYRAFETATIFVRESCMPYPDPDFFELVVESDVYVLFPYEDEKEVREQLEKGTFRTEDSV